MMKYGWIDVICSIFDGYVLNMQDLINHEIFPIVEIKTHFWNWMDHCVLKWREGVHTIEREVQVIGNYLALVNGIATSTTTYY